MKEAPVKVMTGCPLEAAFARVEGTGTKEGNMNSKDLFCNFIPGGDTNQQEFVGMVSSVIAQCKAKGQRIPHLSVLYLFAGPSRRADISYWLAYYSRKIGITHRIEERDIVRDGSRDYFLDDSVWQAILLRIRSGAYSTGLVTPPCNTHSRLLHANAWGPVPVRDRWHPAGFDHLGDKDRERCHRTNVLMDRALEACKTLDAAKAAYLLEFPEDLGRCKSGAVPASLWQLESFQELLRQTSGKTAAFFQCWLLQTLAKPTRVAGTLPLDAFLVHSGMPQFSSEWVYTGPLPKYCGHKHEDTMVKSNINSKFRSGWFAAYPPEMCRMIALMIILDWARKLAGGGGG